MYIDSPGYMTKMTTIPIYGKNPSKSSPESMDGFQPNFACRIGD